MATALKVLPKDPLKEVRPRQAGGTSRAFRRGKPSSKRTPKEGGVSAGPVAQSVAAVSATTPYPLHEPGLVELTVVPQSGRHGDTDDLVGATQCLAIQQSDRRGLLRGQGLLDPLVAQVARQASRG